MNYNNNQWPALWCTVCVSIKPVNQSCFLALVCVGAVQGMVLLWLTTLIPLSKPLCNQFTDSCHNSPTTIHLLILHSSFALMSIGAGGIRSSSLAFGVDQLSKSDRDAGIQESYFSCYYAAVSMASLIGLTVVVYIQDYMGWAVGFGIPVILMLIATVSFFLASPFYVMAEVKRNMISGIAQVLVASYKNRSLQLSHETEDGTYHLEMGSDLLMPTEKLRYVLFLLFCSVSHSFEFLFCSDCYDVQHCYKLIVMMCIKLKLWQWSSKIFLREKA